MAKNLNRLYHDRNKVTTKGGRRLAGMTPKDVAALVKKGQAQELKKPTREAIRKAIEEYGEASYYMGVHVGNGDGNAVHASNTKRNSSLAKLLELLGQIT